MLSDDDVEDVFAYVEKHFAERGALPAIDGSLWPFDAHDLFNNIPRVEWPGAGDLQSSLPTHDVSNPVHRAAVATLIYEISQSGGVSREQYGERFREFVPLLRSYLALREPSAIADVAVLRWEFHAAAAACDIERMMALASRWQAVEPSLENFIVIPRTLFVVARQRLTSPPSCDLTLCPPTKLDDGLVIDPFQHTLSWIRSASTDIPTEEEPFGKDPNESHTDWNMLFFAARHGDLDRWSYLPAARGAQLRREAVLYCAAALQLLGPKRVAMEPDLALIDAWCCYALARLDDLPGQVAVAADKYRSWAGANREAPESSYSLALAAAARCYSAVRRFAEAEEATREWLKAEPESATAHRRLSEVLYKQNRPLEARQAFEDSIRLSPDDEDWSNSLLLQLGLQADDGQRVARALEAAASSSPWRTSGQRLVAWFAPWTKALSPTAASRWWLGIHTLAEPSFREAIDEKEAWSYAASAFGEAVALELRATVFSDFCRRPNPPQQERMTLGDPWKAIYQDRGTLGQLLDALLAGARPMNAAARELSVMLSAGRPQFLGYLRAKSPEELKRLSKLRNRAQHESTVTESDARLVFDEATKLLVALHKDVVRR